MVSRMKTTIDIADSLLDEAKDVAEKERTTLRALVEEGLRAALEARRHKRMKFRLRDASVPGQGLRPGVQAEDWAAIRTLAYEGRGG